MSCQMTRRLDCLEAHRAQAVAWEEGTKEEQEEGENDMAAPIREGEPHPSTMRLRRMGWLWRPRRALRWRMAQWWRRPRGMRHGLQQWR
jgi:hypothetical protein